MKQLITTFAVILIGGLFLTGCSSTPSAVDDSSKWSEEFKNAPEWVVTEGSNIEGALAAVGSSKIGDAGIGHARTNAKSMARNELARQIELITKTMVKNFTQEIGAGEDQTVDRVSVQVSKQVAKQTLSGARPQNSWISPSDTVYSLVALDQDSVKQYIKESMKTSMKKEEALWQKFQAEKGWEELDKEIEKEFNEYKSE